MTETTERSTRAPAFELTSDFLVDSGVGDALRRARESQGLSLQNVALRLRLGAGQIEAIESENWQALPGRVFIVGFVRNYAKFLGIEDVVGLIERLQKALQNEALPKLEIKPGDVIVPPRRADNRALGIALLLLVVVILGYFLLPDKWSDALNNILPEKNSTSTVEKRAEPAVEVPFMVSEPVLPQTPMFAPLEMPSALDIPSVSVPILPERESTSVQTEAVLSSKPPATPAPKPAVATTPPVAVAPPTLPPVAKPAPAVPLKPSAPRTSSEKSAASVAPVQTSSRPLLSDEEQAKIRAENLAKIRAENLAKFREQKQASVPSSND